jgi:hypothetical protein
VVGFNFNQPIEPTLRPKLGTILSSEKRSKDASPVDIFASQVRVGKGAFSKIVTGIL